jgi:hypothetical protein
MILQSQSLRQIGKVKPVSSSLMFAKFSGFNRMAYASEHNLHVE